MLYKLTSPQPCQLARFWLYCRSSQDQQPHTNACKHRWCEDLQKSDRTATGGKATRSLLETLETLQQKSSRMPKNRQRAICTDETPSGNLRITACLNHKLNVITGIRTIVHARNKVLD